MLAPAVTGSGAPTLVMETSADRRTLVVVVALLFGGLMSDVAAVAVAVFVTVAPLERFELARRTSVKVAVAPAGKLAIDAVAALVLPTGGVVSVNEGPLFCASETNVLLAGVSLSVTFVA